MTDEREADDDGRDAALMRRVAAMLTEDGELVPTDEREVMRAEEEGLDDIELPPTLEQFAPDEEPARSTVDLRAYRERRARGLLTHAGAMIFGAVAAAAALVVVWKSGVTEPNMGGDPRRVPPSASAAEPGPILLDASCESCCGGSACAGAKAGLEKCPSGHTCIACDQAVLADSRYRLRVSAVHPAELGRQVLAEFPQGRAEICVRAGLSDEVCTPTHISDRPGGLWTTLPMIVSGDDLAAKLAVRLRWKDVQREPLATAGRWTNPVALTAKSLCSGYKIELVNDDKGEVFGTMSLFLDDAHYVELMRGPETGPLRDLHKRLQLNGVRVQLQEVTGERRGFVLTAGPFHRQTAERLRWQLLEQKQEATTTVGLDYVGEPLPLP